MPYRDPEPWESSAAGPFLTLDQAQAEMSAIAARLAAEHSNANAKYGLRLMSLALAGAGETSQVLGLFITQLVGQV